MLISFVEPAEARTPSTVSPGTRSATKQGLLYTNSMGAYCCDDDGGGDAGCWRVLTWSILSGFTFLATGPLPADAIADDHPSFSLCWDSESEWASRCHCLYIQKAIYLPTCYELSLISNPGIKIPFYTIPYQPLTVCVSLPFPLVSVTAAPNPIKCILGVQCRKAENTWRGMMMWLYFI